MKKENKRIKGITMVALVVTIIVLLILAGVAINLTIGNDGIITRALTAKEENEKQSATELLKTKILDCQLLSYEEKETLPTFAYLVAYLKQDNEIDYVEMESKKYATLDETEYGSWDKLYTKLKKYKYEFEIDSNFQVAINGKKVEDTIPVGYMKIPTETLDITENGNDIDVTNYAKANVNVSIPRPTGTLKVTEAKSNIDVSNYQYVDTSKLFTSKGCDTIKTNFPSSGNIFEIDLGYVPSFFFMKSNLNNKYTIWHCSYDSMKTVYGTNLTLNTQITKTSAFTVNGTKITLKVSNSTDWANSPLEIYAIK